MTPLQSLAREAGFIVGAIHTPSGEQPFIRPIGIHCEVELRRFAQISLEQKLKDLKWTAEDHEQCVALSDKDSAQYRRTEWLLHFERHMLNKIAEKLKCG